MKKKVVAREIVYYIILLLITSFVILPIIIAITNSLRRNYSEIFAYSNKISLYTFLPESPTLAHYVELFKEWNFWRPVVNSFFVSVVTVLGGFLVNALAGFAFAKYQFKGKTVLFTIFLFSFMIPFEVISIPLYKTTGNLGLLNTRLALILPMTGNGMIIFLYRQFFKEIPDLVLILNTAEDRQEQINACNEIGQEWCLVSEEIWDVLSIGGLQNSLYQRTVEELYNHTTTNDTIVLTGLPMYHLEPNTRITVNDDISNIHGDYIITSISYPLQGEEMTINAYLAQQKM